ncbi:porin family protein [Phenylobacterium aquaticum]|uniref:porin family protein n=1 Tax=Phenylobacterium aquaticum TaxID=1763816 RepID=UPI0026E91E0E|nr:porin family protein [Phenylobacterium aquaticum]
MKTLIATAAAGLAAVILAPAAASAQDLTPVTTYGTAGYAASEADGVNLGALQGRIGARFGKYLGLEGEAAFGVNNDKTYVAGVPVKVDETRQVAAYGVGYLPVAPNADIFLRAGYGATKLKASVAGTTASGDGDSWNYGVGGQYFFNDKNGVRADYTRYDFVGSGPNANVWAVSYVRKF